MTTDYTRFEKLVREEEEAEQRKQQESLAASRAKYFQEQEEKKRKWKEEHPNEEVHDHGCGCGFADPDRLKKLGEKKKDEIPLEERNKKKVAAVEATREHGNILFKEGKYEQAFAVYDRGILIINGSYGMSDEQQQKLTQLELTLDLNMAACQLKLKNYLKAIDHCKMALQIEPQHPKAFFRIGQAHLEMGNLAEATQHFKKVAELDPRNADAVKQLGEIRRLEAQQRDQEKQFAKAMAARMAGHRDSAEPPCNSSCP